MPYIDITTMRGMMPRVVTSMLPEHSAVLAEDCHFRFGVITPERQISGVEKTFVTGSFKPSGLFPPA
ncbi:hypothetical protein RPW45_005369, partial [Escherichia coli]|nr:hypothetical protein [Escherichia coli]